MQPLILCRIVFWAGLMLAGPADVLLIFNLTESELLAAPPYLWNPGQVGYSNFAFFVGGLIGVATGGPLSDCTFTLFPAETQFESTNTPAQFRHSKTPHRP